MFDQVVLLWSFIFLLVHLFQVARKAITMAINTNSPSPPSLSWKRLTDLPALAPKRLKYCPEENWASPKANSSLVLVPRPRAGNENVSGLVHEEHGARENFDSRPTSRMARKRPARIVIPESCMSSGFGEACGDGSVAREVEVEGSEYCLASRRGSRHAMEDGYVVITNINGNSKQAFFGVFDGHGGRAAVDFVSEKLGKNIIAALAEQEKEEDQLEGAVKAGYLTTDTQFLTKGVRSGACAATVLLKDGELHVANVGDCRVVMSRKGVANALTNDHRASREDERIRIESSGGYVNCRNGVWRVQDSLAVSRAFGDASMKDWIISEPETKKLCLTPDCEFLVIASDGLWDKVSNQEVVDMVLRHSNTLQACKDLVEISSSRGSRDDITVMIVDLKKFVQIVVKTTTLYKK